MAGTEELLARLQQLEDGYYGDKEIARQNNFFDTYGNRWSNNKSLGMAVLNELDARGIDTSAADEAVQEILDQLRTECQEILDMISNVQETAIENAKKIETISNVVSDKVASNPETDNMPEPTEMPPLPGNEMLEGMSPDGEFMAPPEGGEMVPPEGGEMVPPEGGEMVPPEGGDMANSEFTVSDERMKQIKSLYSARRAKRRV